MEIRLADEYFDCKDNRHTVAHSVIFTESEKEELENRIVEDLYNIFTARRK